MRDAKYKLEELGRTDGKPVAEPEREDEQSQSMSGKRKHQKGNE
jgi:hypothetical protein